MRAERRVARCGKFLPQRQSLPSRNDSVVGKNCCFTSLSGPARDLLNTGEYFGLVTPCGGFCVMLFALGAASSAIDLLSSLTSSSSSSSTSNGQTGIVPASTFSLANPTISTGTTTSTTSGGSTGNTLAPTTMDTLLAAQSQGSGSTSQSSALSDLFS